MQPLSGEKECADHYVKRPNAGTSALTIFAIREGRRFAGSAPMTTTTWLTTRTTGSKRTRTCRPTINSGGKYERQANSALRGRESEMFGFVLLTEGRLQ